MKPKTKLQQEVWELHKGLPNPIHHEAFVISNHDFYYTTHYKNLICLECNHSWRPDTIWHEEVAGVECPNCNKKLEKTSTERGKTFKIITYQVVDVVDRFQVFRYFSCWKNMDKNKKPVYYFRSLFEEWKEYEKNKSVIVGRTQSWAGDGFSYTEYEVRGNSSSLWKPNPYNSFVADINCPNPKFLPRFDKYGITKYEHNCEYRKLIAKLEESNIVETLLKSGQKELLFHAVHKSNNYFNYWNQIKIALRNNYKITDPGIWYDYLDLLYYFNKDLRNPKFILPDNLREAHNDYVKLKSKKLSKEEEYRRIRKETEERFRAEAEEALKGIKAEVFKNFKIKSGKLVIVPLIEEEDVKKEAEILKHCVYSNKYHKKSGILLLSARIENQRIETIEVSLASYKVIQARGYDNKPTPYHKEIISLMKSQMHKISRLVEREKKLKQADANLSKLEKVA